METITATDVNPEQVLKAVAEESRRRALGVLLGHELSVNELVEILGLPQSTVSRHLKMLREAGLITDRREGNAVLYSLPPRASGEANGDLPSRLLAWVAEQPLPSALERRRRVVVDRRRDMSRRFFDRVGRHWDRLREEAFGDAFHLEALMALLPTEWTVADIGTGTGYMLPTLARHFRRVIGVEPVERMLQTARHRVAQERMDNTALQAGDLTRLPLREGSVDLVLAVLVLHHVSDPARAVAELCRIVRPGGHVLIVEQVAHDHAAFRERMQDPWWGFAPGKLEAMVRSAGLCEARTRTLCNVKPASDAPELFVLTGRKTG